MSRLAPVQGCQSFWISITVLHVLCLAAKAPELAGEIGMDEIKGNVESSRASREKYICPSKETDVCGGRRLSVAKTMTLSESSALGRSAIPQCRNELRNPHLATVQCGARDVIRS